MHNNIMAAGSRDRPSMLAPGRYPQWRSWFLRYVDTRPNGEALRKCILSGPYKPKIMLVYAVKATDNCAVIPKHTTEFRKFTSHDGESMESYYMRFYKLMNEMIRNNLIVTMMQVNVQFLQQLQPEWSRFVMIVKQQHKLDKVSYHKLFEILKQYQNEVNELRAEKLARNANPLALVATAQASQDPYYQSSRSHRSSAQSPKPSIPSRSHTTTIHKGKEIAKPITPSSKTASEEESNPEQAQRDKDMQKNLALIAKYFKKIYKPTNDNLITSSNSKNKNVDMTLRYKNDDHSGYALTARYMEILPRNAESRKGLRTPRTTRRRCCYASKLSRVFHFKPSSMTVSNTCLLETDDSNVTPDSPDMCEDDIQNEQNDVESDDERVTLANLIANLKLDVDEYKKTQKQLKKANTTLAQELKECKAILAETNLFRATTAYDTEILIQTCLMPLAIETQSDSLKFVQELKQKMHADLKYVESLEKEIDELESNKAEFSDMYDVILQECVSKDVMCPYLQSLSDLDTLAELQCMYLHKVKECDCLAQRLSKQTESVSKKVHTELLQRFAKVEKHSISLETALQNCKEQIVQLILFIVDSGCTKHMTGNLKLLCNFVEKFMGTVRFGNDQFAPILGYGDLVQENVTINRVYYVEGLNHNLFSVGQFCDANLEVAFRKSTCFVRDLQGNDLLIGNRGSDLYMISLQESTSSPPLCLMAKATPTQAWLWHPRFSHLNFNYINLLSKKDIVIGLPKLKYVKDQLCSSCELSKAKRSSFKSKAVLSSKGRLNLIHIDLCGPMRIASINGKKYILVIVDDYTRYTWTLFLRTEFLNKTLNAFFKEEGIEHQTLTARTPEQNGVVERWNHTLAEAAQTMLSASQLPLFFWAEVIATACYTQNRSIIIPTHDKTPYHIINDRKPLIKHLYIFGCICYITRDGENLDKMKEKGDQCILVGYSTQSKGYRVYNKRTRMIVESIHIHFDEIKEVSETSIANNTSGLMQMFHHNKSWICYLVLYLEMCMFALTVSTAEPKNIKEAMADSAWIEAMQEELHQFDRIQAKYTLEILHKHGMDKGQSIGTPMAMKPKLDADLSGNPVDQTAYHSKIGSLMYLISSRPNIVQADSSFVLTAFSDADNAGCIDSRKSTSGGIQFLVLWMRTQLQDYGFNYNKIPLYRDSQSAIAISCNLVQQSRTKHVHTRYHFIKEQVENGITELYFFRTEYQLADMFTKALPEDRFKYLVRQIVLRYDGGECDKERMPTKIELTLEQSQQGVSNDVLMEILLEPASNKLKKDSNYLIHSYRVVCFETFRKPKRKNTQVPQPSGSTEHVADEAMYKELDDSLEMRIDDIDADEDITLVNVQANAEMFNADKDLGELKTSKPKAKGVVIQEPSESPTTTTTIPKQKSQDNGKGIMVEEPVKLKKKDQIRLDKEVALKLQDEFDEEQRLATEKAQKKLEANIVLIET
nr:retrovirus-related Pol polyprotein from transposon TNT 1-94 [Tanacetum cinerariifolium]